MANFIVFIDARVEDKELLISHFTPETEYHIFAPDLDGIDQMTCLHAAQYCVSAMRIIPIGAPGSIIPGCSVLNLSSPDAFSLQLSAFGNSLSQMSLLQMMLPVLNPRRKLKAWNFCWCSSSVYP